ncbi:hypothetical protein P2318_20130 [Myxococcaceae bacterium GXIMD 01537]
MRGLMAETYRAARGGVARRGLSARQRLAAEHRWPQEDEDDEDIVSYLRPRVAAA